MKIRISDLMDFYEAEPYSMAGPPVVSAERITELTMNKLGLDTPPVRTTKKVRISDMLDGIEDDSFSIREKNIIPSERIIEATMAKLHADSENNKTDRKKLRKGALAAIILAACLALSAAAYATGVMSRLVNWQGETVGEAEQPLETPMPSDEDVDRLERTQSILDETNRTELVLVKYTDKNGVTGTKSSGLSRTFWSVEELETALPDKDSELLVFEAPAGYGLYSAEVMYDCKEGFEYTLISSETDDSGLTIEKYILPREGAIVSGYLIDFRDADGNSLLFVGRLIDSDVEFVVDENETVERISVDGMDSALVIEQTDGTGVASVSLEMSKALSIPIVYVNRALLSGAHPTEDGDIFTKVWYSIHANGMDADMLREWISTERPVVD